MRSAVIRDIPELEIRLLGHASIFVAGAPVKVARRATTLAMLGSIVLQRGRPVARDALAFTLFPDVDEAAALGGLRRYLLLANKALPARAGEPRGCLILRAMTLPKRRWRAS
jgi:DNA-binding SARP family transcriptional activator